MDTMSMSSSMMEDDDLDDIADGQSVVSLSELLKTANVGAAAAGRDVVLSRSSAAGGRGTPGMQQPPWVMDQAAKDLRNKMPVGRASEPMSQWQSEQQQMQQQQQGFSTPPPSQPSSRASNAMRGVARKESVYVSLPDGVEAGQVIKTQSPDGHTFKFTVPEGVRGGDMVQVEVPRAKPKPNKVMVKVPEGCRPGDEMMAKGPDGTPFTCVIPPGYGPGDVLSFELRDPKTHAPKDVAHNENSMNTSGQFVVKVPMEAMPGQVVYDRTGFGDIFGYVVPPEASPDSLTLVWPIGADQAAPATGRRRIQKAMSAHGISSPFDTWDDETDDSVAGGARSKSPVTSDVASNDSFHTANSSLSKISAESGIGAAELPRGKKSIFVASHHMNKGLAAAEAMEGAAGGRGPPQAPGRRRKGDPAGAKGVMGLAPIESEGSSTHQAAAGAAGGVAGTLMRGVPAPDYSSDDEEGTSGSEHGRNPGVGP